jgi:hypothetical protein
MADDASSAGAMKTAYGTLVPFASGTLPIRAPTPKPIENR